MKLDDHIIPPPERKPSIAAQLQKLYKGQSFTVPKKKNTRTGLYAIAKKAGVKITTQVTQLNQIRVWRMDGEEMPRSEHLNTIAGHPIAADWQSIEADQAREPSRENLAAVKMLESWIEEDEEQMSQKETIAGLRDLVRLNMAGVKASEIYGDEKSETIDEDWRFTKDKPQYDDSGRVFRKQYLMPDGKRTRTVEVSEYDHEEIIKTV